MESWDEIRTAYHVARIGTVSGAAEALGVHHATVIRHVDALEGALGTKLFQRHARGYTPTEAGRDLLEVARGADDQIAQLAARIKAGASGVAGEVTVTSLRIVSDPVTDTLAALQREHPDLNVRYVTDERLLKLEYGEAHVAIRAGTRPSEPDNVVQPFGELSIGLYASEGYAAEHGLPGDEAGLAAHRYVSLGDGAKRVPFVGWLHERVPASSVVFNVSEQTMIAGAVSAGIGIGFVTVMEAQSRGGLLPALDPPMDWKAPLWLVTHVDLHRSAKVQAVLGALKSSSAGWSGFTPA